MSQEHGGIAPPSSVYQPTCLTRPRLYRLLTSSVVVAASVVCSCSRALPADSLSPPSQNSSTFGTSPQGHPAGVPEVVGRLTSLLAPSVPPGNLINSENVFSGVSPDGQWLAANTPNGLALVNTNGTRYNIKFGDGYTPNVIYGETPTGDLLLGGNAGGGGVYEVYRPGYGVVKQLSTSDQFTERASISNKGHLLSLLSNTSGAGPDKKLWTTVDGHTEPALAKIVDWAWSPNGVTLAAEVSTSLPSSLKQTVKLVLYKADTREFQTLSDTVPFDPGTASRGDSPIWEEAQRVGWSSDGRYLGEYTANGLQVYNHDTGKKMSLTMAKSTLNWTFLSQNELCVLEPGGFTMDLYTIKNDQLVLSKEDQPQQPIVAYQPIGDGSVLVSNPLGEIDLLTAQTFATILPQGVANTNGNIGNWWYNFSEHNLYYVDGVGTSDAKVRVLPVPSEIQGDIS